MDLLLIEEKTQPKEPDMSATYFRFFDRTGIDTMSLNPNTVLNVENRLVGK